MSDRSNQELERAGRELAQAWREPLLSLSQRRQGGIPDWDRVFPGLVAAIGLQSLLWPRFVNLVSAPGGSSGADTAYAEPPATVGDEVYRFAYGHAGGDVAWVAVSAPGMLDWQRLRPIFADRDVLLCLSSLNAQGHIVISGRAPGMLAPLIGRTFAGDQPVGLPVCDCDAIVPMLPDWQASLQPLEPVLTAVAATFRAAPADAGTPANADAAGAFGRIVWCAWRELMDLGLIKLIGGPAVANKSLLGRLLGPRELAPFRGALLLRGDHWELWQRIKGSMIQKTS